MSEVKSIAKSDIVDITTLQLWDKNPRSINKERFAELKTRLSRQGQIKPLLVTKDGVVIGGNMRLRALTELGVKEVWVSVTDAVTDKEIFDLALTDNEEFGYYEQEQVAELALSLGLTPLELKSYSLSLGAPTTLDLVLDKFGPEPEEDEVPEVDEENTYSIEGEVYQLGPHRVMCGDSTNVDAVTELMDGAKADMVFTDPPYGISALGGRRQTNETKKIAAIENDDLRGETLIQFLNDSLGLIPIKASAGIYICYGWKSQREFTEAIYQLDWTPRATITWVKNVFGLSAKNSYGYRPQTEFIYYATKTSEYNYKWYGGGTQSDVWNVNRPTERVGNHPTPKPIELCAKAIRNSSERDDIVVDIFLGSGATLMAAEVTGRVCYGMELDPKYVDVIRKRYAKHVGEEEAWQEATPAVIQ